jgi:hypothetical protein
VKVTCTCGASIELDTTVSSQTDFYKDWWKRHDFCSSPAAHKQRWVDCEVAKVAASAAGAMVTAVGFHSGELE